MSVLHVARIHTRRAGSPHVVSSIHVMMGRCVHRDAGRENALYQDMRQHDTQIAAEDTAQNGAAQAASTGDVDKTSQSLDDSKPRKLSMAERDAALMEKWRDREGSLANTEFEDGQAEGGYRRNVKANIFRYI